MNTSEVNLERPARARPPEAKAAVRALSLYVVPHVAEDRGAAIAKTAYLNAARRGFAPGHELEDWLAAENEVDQRLAGEGRAF
jgi:Protein of unknown function (DUF2934)